MKIQMKKVWVRRNDTKGFTLVELIVVLVILAILAAIMVPSMIGWIDKAKEKEITLTARNAYLAAQELVFEEYAANNTAAGSISIDVNDIQDFAKCSGTPRILSGGISDDYIITSFEYTEDKYVATYSDGKWEVGKSSS
ncbi:MAG: type II secretion system protein [Lachnospiraceae bacterium]